MTEQKGIIQNNTNTFAAFYRIIDVVIIQSVLALSLWGYGVSFNNDYLILTLIATIGFSFSSESLSLYRSWRSGFFMQIVFYVFLSWFIAAISILAYLFFTKTSITFSRVVVAIWFALTFCSLLGWRVLFSLFLQKVRAKGYNTRKVAIIGFGPSGERLAQQIIDHPETGYRLEAIFDDRHPDRLNEKYRHLVKGNADEGINRTKQNEYDYIFVTLPLTDQERIKNILFKLGDTTANVQVVPDLFVYCLMSASMSHVGDVQTISVYNNPMKGAKAAFKRFDDIVLSLVILTIIAIPLMFIAVGIKLTSRGPVLFKQDRYGIDGRKIKVWKFRTMTVSENSDKVVQATKNDTRVTPFGAFLRRTSLDELPQFFNALRGDMSVVGPRPHAVAHNEEYRKQVDYYMLRHKVKPGITGWAQVNGWRGETDTLDKMEMRVKYDLEYIRNWSLWLDVKIVFMTIFKSFNDKNAY